MFLQLTLAKGPALRAKGDTHGPRRYGPGVSGSSRPDAKDADRRTSERFPVEWAVDCVAEETFLYAEITNISQMGIFVACAEPFEIGTRLSLRFRSSQEELSFSLPGQVQWVNQKSCLSRCRNPGMGIRFVDLSQGDRERIVEIIHTIAYLRAQSN